MEYVKNGSIELINIRKDSNPATIYFKNGSNKNFYLAPDINYINILIENDVRFHLVTTIQHPLSRYIGVFIITMGFLLVLFFIIFIPNLIN